MSTPSAALRRDVRETVASFNLDSRNGKTDGYISVKELEAAIANWERVLAMPATISGDPQLDAMLQELRKQATEALATCKMILPHAMKAEAKGAPGYAYMSAKFYKLKLAPDEIKEAVKADVAGNNDGMVKKDEVVTQYKRLTGADAADRAFLLGGIKVKVDRR